jgi:8-oxo-dGTP diphosphatase
MSESQGSSARVTVAVGLIVQEGKALIAWRDAKRHQGNRYEFAGGKVDAGETAHEALVRELHEELGITVTQSRFLHALHHHYVDKHVCLQVFYVDAFEGEPVGREGQPLRWVPVEDLPLLTFPDANAPIVRAAQLPCHYIVTPNLPEQGDRAAWLAQLVAQVARQAWLYIRLPALSDEQQCELIRALHQARPDLRLMVSSHLQSAGLPVCGYHLRQAALMALQTLNRTDAMQYWFAACHDASALAHAAALGVDAMVVGAIHATPTHPHQVGMGWAGLADLLATRERPVYALGGVAPQDLATAQAAGAWGVAGIRAFLTTPVV